MIMPQPHFFFPFLCVSDQSAMNTIICAITLNDGCSMRNLGFSQVNVIAHDRPKSENTSLSS
jgi:hypothetical protein